MESKTPGKEIANLIMNDLKGLLKKNKLTIEESPIAPEFIGFLGRCIASGSLDKKQAKKLLTDFFNENLEAKQNE